MSTVSRSGSAGDKVAFYRTLCEQLGELLGRETDLVANSANAASLLFHSLPDVNWVGFYFASDSELVLGPFQGKPACVRIAYGKGVCGSAAAQNTTLVVPDVNAFPGHIACDAASKSEIVVPLLNWGKLIGVLDIDSASPDRFDEDDKDGIESLAAVFLSTVDGGEMPDLNPSLTF